jgi:hypothetical protein
MYVGNRQTDRIVQEYRLTVGCLNHQEFIRNVCHHGVTDQGLLKNLWGCFPLRSGKHHDILTMNLLEVNKILPVDALGDTLSVPFHIFILISKPKADIQTLEGLVTETSGAKKNSVADAGKIRQMLKPIK